MLKYRGHAGVILLDALERDAAVIALVREHRLQHLEQPAPGRHRLREGALGDDVSGAVEDDAAREHDAIAVLLFLDAGGAKCIDQARQDRDAGAATFEHSVGALEDVDIPAAAVEQVAGDQTAERAAD